MKPKVVEGYILAFGFLCTYKTENIPTGDLALIFSRDEMIRNAKILVNKYYGLGE